MELNWKQRTQDRILVDAATAKEWLKRNKNNRKLSKNRVCQFVRMIEDGGWVYNGQPITFDVDGRLTDGQHRLSAIAASDKRCELLVCTGLPRKAAYTQDTGIRRSLSEQARREGVVPSPTIVSQWAQTWVRLSSGNSALKFNTSDLTEWYNSHRESIDWLLSVREKSALFHAPVCVVLLFAFEHDKTKAASFVERFKSGANLRTDDPVYQLREQALRVNTRGINGQKMIASRAASAVAADFGGRKLVRLVRSDSSLLEFIGADER